MGPDRPTPPVEDPVTPDVPPTIPEPDPARPLLNRATRRRLARLAKVERRQRSEWIARHESPRR